MTISQKKNIGIKVNGVEFSEDKQSISSAITAFYRKIILVYLTHNLMKKILNIKFRECRTFRVSMIKYYQGLTMKEETKGISCGQFRSAKKLTGKGELLAPLIKQLTEAALEAEIESHIADDFLSGRRNRCNGSNKKTIKGTSDGTFELESPRDRNRIFEPQIVKKTKLPYQMKQKKRSIK